MNINPNAKPHRIANGNPMIHAQFHHPVQTRLVHA